MSKPELLPPCTEANDRNPLLNNHFRLTQGVPAVAGIGRDSGRESGGRVGVRLEGTVYGRPVLWADHDHLGF